MPSKRVAPGDATKREPRPPEKAVLLERANGVRRARRIESARATHEGSKGELIRADDENANA